MEQLVGVFICGTRIKRRKVLSTDRQRLVVLNRVEKNEVTDYVTFNRKQKRFTATLKSFEEIGATEAHQSSTGARKVSYDLNLRSARQWLRIGGNLISKPIPWQLQVVYCLNNSIGIKACILIVRIGIVNFDFDSLRNPGREIRTCAVLKR